MLGVVVVHDEEDRSLDGVGLTLTRHVANAGGVEELVEVEIAEAAVFETTSEDGGIDGGVGRIVVSSIDAVYFAVDEVEGWFVMLGVRRDILMGVGGLLVQGGCKGTART